VEETVEEIIIALTAVNPVIFQEIVKNQEKTEKLEDL